MPASFKPGVQVQINVTPPKGEVKQLSVDSEGSIQYLVEYVDSTGVTQQRWFKEEELAGA